MVHVEKYEEGGLVSHLEQRMIELGWKIADKEVINGLHAGDIIRISILDRKNNIQKLVYKECGADRNSEIEIYNKLLPGIESFVPVIKVWDAKPEAILMEDLEDSLKEKFAELPIDIKKSLLIKILLKLSDLHTNNSLNFADLNLPEHHVTTEWYDWCWMQFEKLNSLKLDWFNSNWVNILKEAYKYIESDFKISGPVVLTHGDPHLDNIFKQNNGSICFIDWEWTALGSPLRDLTILLQDIYDSGLGTFVTEYYYKLLNDKGINIDRRNYKEDFNYLYIDHTLMMLAWEIEKYVQGYITERKIKKVIEFKLGQISNSVKELDFFLI